MEKNKSFTGSFFCILSACLWGISGAAGQYLFREIGVTPEWVVAVRTFFSGILLLAYLQLKEGSILRIWKQKKDATDLVLFAIFGVLASQYTYFVTINFANAATATVLQFQAPIMIVVFLSFRFRKMPSKMEFLAIAFALTGTFLLATHGNFKTLSISPSALVVGVISAAAMAFYTAYPKRLMSIYDTMYLVGWAMLIGGIAMNFLHPLWKLEGSWNTTGVLCLLYTTFLGTLVPCLLFMMGVKKVGPTKGSLLMSMEPLSAAIVSVVWLKTPLQIIDYVGFFFIIFTVFLLTKKTAPKAADVISDKNDSLPL